MLALLLRISSKIAQKCRCKIEELILSTLQNWLFWNHHPTKQPLLPTVFSQNATTINNHPIMNRESDNLQALGKATKYRDDYAPEVLESFENKHPGNDYWVRFNCPEFTSLCPITGQPDFAEIRINYLPDHKMVESKSLKLYLFSFRNHGDFHEDCVNIIMKDLIKLMDPKYIEVTGIFTPRGGISIYPYANYGRPGTKYEKMAEFRLLHHDLHV